MASAVMAWVWIVFALARLSDADNHWKRRGHFPGHDPLFAAAPEDRTKRGYSAPVWSFLRGEEPQLSLTRGDLKSNHFVNLSASKVNCD